MNMFSKNLVAVCVALATLLARGEDQPNQTPQKFATDVSKKVSTEYLLFLPKGYEQEQSKKWPLIVFLHGAGERGSDLNKVTVHGPPKWVKSHPDFPFIVASPQCPAGKIWDKDMVLALKDELISKYRVDKTRTYLTGLSMGGFGTWDVLASAPDAFAAYAPICGGGQPIGIWLAEGSLRNSLQRAPVWAFHGGKDPIVSPLESQRMIDALKNLKNGDAKLTIYPEANHDSWTQTYANQELYDWFLAHKSESK
jgi:predicted peptidase